VRWLQSVPLCLDEPLGHSQTLRASSLLPDDVDQMNKEKWINK